MSLLEVSTDSPIYSIGNDKKIYKQVLSNMDPQSPWLLAGGGDSSSITVDGDTIFSVGSDKQVYKQAMSTMSTSSDWALAGKGSLLSVAIDGDMIYGVGDDNQIYKQVLSTMSPSSDWSWAGKGDVTAIAIDGDSIYGVGMDHLVYKQTLSAMSTGEWSLAGRGFIRDIAIDGDTIYATGLSKRVWQQSLATMTPTSQWSLAGAGDVLSLATTSKSQMSNPCEGQELSLITKLASIVSHPANASTAEIRLEMARRAFALMGPQEETISSSKTRYSNVSKTGAEKEPASTSAVSKDQPQEKVSLAASVELSQEGYSAVASICCPLEMSRYTERLITHRGFKVCDEGSLQSLVAWYYCANQSQTFSELAKATMKAIDGDCAWVGTESSCPEMSKTCSRFPDTAGRRRACVQHRDQW